MAEIVYKLFFFIMMMIFFSVGFLLKQKLNYWKLYHGLDFVSIDNNFAISTGTPLYFTRNIVYVKDYPTDCKKQNTNSLICLAALKSQMGVYNGLAFFS